MKNTETKMDRNEMGVLSIPDELLEAAGIPQDSDLVVEAAPGVLLIGREEPLRTANQPLLDLFDAIGIKPEEIRDALNAEDNI